MERTLSTFCTNIFNFRRAESRRRRLSNNRAIRFGLRSFASVLLGCVLAWPAFSAEPKPAPSAPLKRHSLPNGLTLLLQPIPGADRAALETFYRVGFLDEPKSMTQSSHLLEHLITQGATRGYPAGKSLSLLTVKGMANAETMPHFTHFDFIVPPADLELALQIEAERLTSLVITPDLIAQEAPKCYQEADFVEKNPQAGMLKHAFMAYAQAWRYRSPEVSIRSGLEAMQPAALEAMRKQFYHPRNLIVAITGGFKPEEALALVKKHLGSIQPTGPKAPEAIDWKTVPSELITQWDAKIRAFCMAFAPPAAPRERLLLSLWGNIVLQRLSADPEIKTDTDFVFCSNQSWSVGKLPFFVYATPKTNVSILRVQRLLTDRITALRERRPNETEMNQLRLMLQDLAQNPEYNWDMLQRQGQMLSQQTGQPSSQGTALVLGNIAVQLGMRELLLEPGGNEAAAALQKISAEELFVILQKTLDPNRRSYSVLLQKGAVPRP